MNWTLTPQLFGKFNFELILSKPELDLKPKEQMNHS